jgi:hypothetical protein
LTDRRVIRDVYGISPSRYSIPLSQLQFVQVQPSDGTDVGNIYFRDLVLGSGDDASVHREGLIAVSRAEDVARLFRAAIEKPPSHGPRVVSG